jgi:Pentapeptide repeats (8 copies)
MSEEHPEEEVTPQQPMKSQQSLGEELALPDLEELVFFDLKPGHAWGESITKRRAANLAGMLQAWEQEGDHGKRKGPFDSVWLTGADVFWLAARTAFRMDNAHAIPAAAIEPLTRTLQSKVAHSIIPLRELHLDGAIMNGVILSGAQLGQATFLGASLREANLEGARLDGVDLAGANLSGANLCDVDLVTISKGTSDGDDGTRAAHRRTGAVPGNGRRACRSG